MLGNQLWYIYQQILSHHCSVWPPLSINNNNPAAFQIKNPLSFREEDGIARLVISEAGRIIYANTHFKDLAQLTDTPKQEKANKLIRFEKNVTINEITSGVYTIFLREDTIPLKFHFDWVEMIDKGRYLIASEITEIQPSLTQEDREFFAEKIMQAPLTIPSNDADYESEKELITALGSLKEQGDLRNFLNMSNEVMIVANEDGNLVRVNKAFHRLFGYKNNAFTKLNFMDLFDNSERASVRNYLQNLTVHEDNSVIGIIDFEASAISQGNTNYWTEWRLQNRAGYIYCVGRDLTAAKSHEEELSKREHQLMEAELIGRMGHWRWVIGQDGIDWSDQIFRIFGVAPEEFTPSIDSLNQMVHRRDVGRVIQAFQRAIIEQNDYDMEFRIVRPGADIRYIRCEGRCEKDADGDVIALYGVMQDMTERMLYERELKEAKDAAERAYAAKSQFLANMSHELRTPLNAIIGFSEMMQRQLLGPIGTEKYLDYIAGIRESGEHLLDLISDILDMSKIEAGKYELDLESVNITKTMKLAVHMMEGRALESGIKIITDDLKNENLNIIADRRAFMQIILNLLSNAVKFSNEGGKIYLECHERPEFISIKVRDEGVGIPANKLQCIMRPFEQASSSYSRDHEGSGLGLAITKELVEMHEGTLLIDSKIGNGTTVTVRIPYQQK